MNAVSGRYVGLLYAAPAILFVLVFLVYPLGQLVYTSLTSASLLGGGEYVGFRELRRAPGTTRSSGRRFSSRSNTRSTSRRS